jgi:outer membrane protein TolC
MKLETNPASNQTPPKALRLVTATMRCAQTLALAGWIMATQESHAGGLLDVYNQLSATSDPTASVSQYKTKAAEQNVITQKRGYLPRLTVNANVAWAYQDIIESGSPLFPSGKEDFDRTRSQVEFDQPLFDPSIKSSIDVSKAQLKQTEAKGRLSQEYHTQRIIHEYLRLARFKELIGSADRVITKLESESESITKSNNAKIATINEVQSIKLSLAAMRRERNNFELQQNRSLAILGVGPEAVKAATINPNSLKSFAADASPKAPLEENQAEIRVLEAEAAEFASQAKLEKKRWLPTVSLYAQYGLFKDGGSVFGGPLNQNIYEAGLVLRWNIFDRGIGRSKAKEYEYLVKAKEAELAMKQQENQRLDNASKHLLSQSTRSLDELADIVEQSKVLKDSAFRAYDAGKETYINFISAYLASEASIREWIAARHELVMNQVIVNAQTQGWNRTLVENVDRLFAGSN